MTIDEAVVAVDNEYDAELKHAETCDGFGRLMADAIHGEYDEMDRVLPGYVGEIGAACGLEPGTVVPFFVYQMARMCFRLGMRAQRKLDRPEEPTTTFWRADRREQ